MFPRLPSLLEALLLLAFLVLVMPFIGFGFSGFGIPTLFQFDDKPQPTDEALIVLLAKIVYSLNVFVLSAFIVYRTFTQSYLRAEYSSWQRALRWEALTKTLFGHTRARRIIYCLLVPLSLTSLVLFILHARTLGRGLGYW